MWVRTRIRARKTGIPFNIEVEDIRILTLCPILGIRLAYGRGTLTNASPTLDRIVPELGYVKGNVAVISHKANRLKSDGTAAEHARIAAWMYHWNAK